MKRRPLFFLALAALMAPIGCSSSQSAAEPVAAAPVTAPQENSHPAAPAPQSAEDAWRAEPPKIGPVPALHAPVPEKKLLANGLTLMSVHKAELPLVSVAVVFRSGSAQDPHGLEGLGGFTADMMKMGTTKRSAAAIAEEVEARGSSIEVGVDEDAISFGATALKDNIGAVLDVLADVLQHPAFKKDEIERVRTNRLATLTAMENEPRATADNVFRRLIYGGHPYGHSTMGDEASTKKVTAKHLKDFFTQNLRPSNAAIVVVGALSTAEVEAEIQKRLGDWKGPGATQKAPPKPAERPAEFALVSRPGAPQSELFIGELGVSRADPDYFSLVLCNAILGGQFNSRINMNLREDKGYTYGARSAFDFMRERGPFFVSTGVRTDATAPAIKEVLKEIETIRTSDVTADELKDAKSRYALSLSGKFQTVDAVTGMMASLYLHDLPLDFFQHLPEHLNAVSVADVRRVAEQHLHPDKLTIVVVGDKKVVEPTLDELHHGAVHLRDVHGNTL